MYYVSIIERVLILVFVSVVWATTHFLMNYKIMKLFENYSE